MAQPPVEIADLPDLYTYRSLLRYIEHWQHAREAIRRPYSLRWLERAAKLENGFLASVMDGEGLLTDVEVGRVAEAMGLTGELATFCGLLGTFTFSPEVEVQRAVLLRAVVILEQRAEALGQGPAFRARLHGYYHGIQVLASWADFQADPAWIAAHLHSPVSLDDLGRALEDLTALGGVREAFIPRLISVHAGSDLADVMAVDEHLRRTAALLKRDVQPPRLATSFWAVTEAVIPEATGLLLGQKMPVIAQKAVGSGGCDATVAVERLLRVYTVAGPVARRRGAARPSKAA